MASTSPLHPKPTDTTTLFQQHVGRLSLIIGLLSVSICMLVTGRRDESSTAQFYGGILTTLVLLNWLRIEIMLIHRRKSLPPGEMGYPLIGEILKFIKNPNAYDVEKVQKYGLFYSEKSLQPSLNVVVNHHEDIAWLWKTDRKMQSEASWPPPIKKLLGTGSVAIAEGKKHKFLRRVLEPAFTPNATREYTEIVDKGITKSLKDWESDGSYHSSTVFKLLALRLFFLASFGSVDEDIMLQLHNDFILWFDGFATLFPFEIAGSTFHKAMQARRHILNVVDTLIDQFKAENPPDSVRGTKSMMGRMVYGNQTNDAAAKNTKEVMNDSDLRENVLNMVFAGHDTTYASLGTALHYLAENPHVENELTKEVKSFKEPLDFDELKNAPVLNAFMSEVWRIDAPVASSFRKLKQSFEYKGFKLPQGILVRYGIRQAGRDESVFPSPESFEIQRFLPKDHALMSDPKFATSKAKDAAANPVFGGGRRLCLGSHFAKLEMRIFFTRLLQEYRVEVRNSEKITFPMNGWKNEFKLTKRAAE